MQMNPTDWTIHGLRLTNDNIIQINMLINNIRNIILWMNGQNDLTNVEVLNFYWICDCWSFSIRLNEISYYEYLNFTANPFVVLPFNRRVFIYLYLISHLIAQIQYQFIAWTRTDVGPKFNLFMKCDARDYRWGTSLSKRVYRLIFLLYFHLIRLLCILLVAWLSDYALIGATQSASPLWFIECGWNKRNNLMTDFRKSNTDYSTQMFVCFGLIRHFLIKTVVDDY